MTSTRTVQLGAVAEFINGAAFGPEHWEPEGRRIIRIQNLTGQSDVFNRTTHDVDPKYHVQCGDLLVSWSATLGVFEWAGPDVGLVNQHIFRVVPDSKQIDKRYLKRSLDLAVGTMSKFTHGSTMKHINRREFLDTVIPLPPLAEQKRIAAILDKADAIRRRRQEAARLADQLIPSLFYEMFGDPAVNPKGWPTEKLAYVAQLDRGRSRNRPRDEPSLYGGPYPLIQTGDIANSNGVIRKYTQTYSEAGLAQSKLWPKGTLCITIAANIGMTAILDFDACFPDSVVGLVAGERVTIEYVREWFVAIQKRLDESAPQSAQKNINLAILNALKIPVPPKPLQEQFSRAVADVHASQEKIEFVSIEAGNLFNSLVQQAFRGEL